MRFKTAALALVTTAIISTSAVSEELKQYSSDSYVQNQYEIIKLKFDDLDVSREGTAIKIIIPTDYGFETGKSTLKRSMKDTLREFAHFLNTYPETTIQVVGFTDSRGDFNYNKQLGLTRAKAVEAVLLEAKVTPFRMKTYSEGEELPRCTNQTQKGQECNRRVEMTVAVESNLEF